MLLDNSVRSPVALRAPARMYPIADIVAVITVIALAVVLEWGRLVGAILTGMDAATAFYPWYSFLGEQLRAGHIPVWNPNQFAGAPFAADPESGWMYLPAMLAFTFLPLEAAAKSFQFVHVLIAALSMYALARALSASVLGSLLASTVYAHSGFLEGHVVCCFAYAGVAVWLPLMLLGTELAILATCWRARVFWWAVGGFALSQILAAWMGQGAYYAMLVLAMYIAYRTIFDGSRPIRARVINLLASTAGLLAFGFTLAAAGLLPRLEYNMVSNLPGGYPSSDVSLFATTWLDWGIIDDWQRRLLEPGYGYVGWLTLVLAIAAPLVAHGRVGVPFFLVLGLGVLVLARAEPTPLHALFALLPGFEGIHARSPERILIVFYLAPALLSAATLTRLQCVRPPVLAALTGALVLAFVVADYHIAWTAQEAEAVAGGADYPLQRVDLATYYAPSGAARFLLSQTDPDSFRYFGYAQHVFSGPMPYTLRWGDPSITALEVNNRAMMTGLDDVQGYNPVHLSRYDHLIAAINGQAQNYHHADIFDSGLNSSLLDLLSARYILVPAVTASDEIPAQFDRPLKSVFDDGTVRVLEDPNAFPRAWIVHAAQQVAPGQAAQLLAGSNVDLRRIAVLEEPPPPLQPVGDSNFDEVRVESYAADRIQLQTRSDADGLVVLSEVYYSAWHAYVDGRPAAVYAADEALRAVAVPAGNHTIELRYESTAVTAGIVISVAAGALLLILVASANVHSPW